MVYVNFLTFPLLIVIFITLKELIIVIVLFYPLLILIITFIHIFYILHLSGTLYHPQLYLPPPYHHLNAA